MSVEAACIGVAENDRLQALRTLKAGEQSSHRGVSLLVQGVAWPRLCGSPLLLLIIAAAYSAAATTDGCQRILHGLPLCSVR